MPRRAPQHDVSDDQLSVTTPKSSAAGLPAVLSSIQHAQQQMGAKRTLLTLLNVNQANGFDCPGCAWPEGEKRHTAEFCENGAKAVAEEATLRRVGPEFFAEHSVHDLAERSDYWLGQQGRLTHPVHKPVDSDYYSEISWDEAFQVVRRELDRLHSPDEAVFYTSGRTSNEAAFLYQLFARMLGTNNLPDCSNMCHESSGLALNETIGIGKGSVQLADLEQADLIFVVGQNPGTNHPRMLGTLEEAKRRGARIITVNPLPEAGMIRFKDPKKPSGMLGRGTELTDLFLQIRVNGDLALFQALGRMLVDAGAVDRDFIEAYTWDYDSYAAHVKSLDWGEVLLATGLSEDDIAAAHAMVTSAQRIVVCWAMGLTQHRNSVPTIREVVNFLLLRGNIGRPGTGVCPVRGHSNVQGDRTMGIHEKPKPEFLDALAQEFGFQPPREPGHDVVESIRAMRDGRARVFMAVGGNFVSATPDTEVTEAALRTCALTVQVSTKLNRSHAVTGRQALILPTLGRTEIDVQGSGRQFVTVEDSMSAVHASRGQLRPAADTLLSEVAIVSRLARTVLGANSAPWREFEEDYDRIRDRIAAVVPGFHDFTSRAEQGFVLPHPPRDERRFTTANGRANFSVNELEVLRTQAGELILQTLRSHDQYNTTIYGLDDRYRGISQGRRVVFVHPDDLAERGIADGETVDLVAGDRRAERFRVVSYPTARSCAAAYFPETNVLVPLDSTARGSNTPTSKSVVIRLERSAPRPVS
ncbi:FdhF/YdeP family oxidoreductase [Lipingzhangella sp. LS1_29]|uniref:FdhF/YdeP family oxidoreductase n=1 Tax=Lipingzhangella rawalii TaxID=2055835 RepID=A0ABU2H6G7_9ACTN|nr:FdhF/YdeP family oxidoreductase [Lipingzhangella rawalii]MDS1270876.1 FdhF/YdeP family oxidoreductase [Lipingzhangella rawalii]